MPPDREPFIIRSGTGPLRPVRRWRTNRQVLQTGRHYVILALGEGLSVVHLQAAAARGAHGTPPVSLSSDILRG